LKPQLKLAFTTGTDDLNRRLVQRMRQIFPDLPLWVVSDFPPEDADLRWIPWRLGRGFFENFARCRAELRGYHVRLAAVILVPNVPFRRMRLAALLLSPAGFLAFNENLNNFMLRPRSLPTMLGHARWRAKNLLRWSVRTARRADWPALFWYASARAAGFLRLQAGRASVLPSVAAQPGISVVIPSRNGRELLAAQLPGIVRDLARFSAEIIVVDNGSQDGTADWLRNRDWRQSGTDDRFSSSVNRLPRTRQTTENDGLSHLQVEVSPEPLSFARAVNRGIARARYSHVCLLNNDMLIEPGFFGALRQAFDRVPDLFCASAQIRFPQGARREETGKTVMAQQGPLDFPIRCDEPLAAEDHTWVLYGSGGCSLYDAAKLRALGGADEAYQPAYVEDLDLGYRAWRRGWPTAYAAGAMVEHRHRATTSRYFTAVELERILEVNYLKFLARSIGDAALFRRLWAQATLRLRLLAGRPAARAALRAAPALALAGAVRQPPAAPGAESEPSFLALTDGSVALFPGRPPSGKPRVLVVSPYLPFPLAHGGAVRMYNLMRRAAADFDQVLVAFSETLAEPPPEVLQLCAEVILVRRKGSHSLPVTSRPEVVEEFDSPVFHAALRLAVRKWRPALAQIEFTQLAQYAPDCSPAPTILVEHDITFDLYEQLLRAADDPELRRQAGLWRSFETAAWRRVTRVAVMSRKDSGLVTGAPAVVLPNGVDLERFRPAPGEPAPRRALFIGSFAHLPNLLALDFFLSGVWPLLHGATLHIIAGPRPEYFLARYRDRVKLPLSLPGIELEAFVADVRPAYQRAAVVVAPLVASAGTNIKILEAMAMGKAIVSTPAGVNGLDLAPGSDFLLAHGAAEMAAHIETLFTDPPARRRIESAARARVERDFDWDAIARRQSALYRELIRRPGRIGAAPFAASPSCH
jgi:GT2 family glycosyltransferase/glycosyltransferase involved in cell wall biosynthesis